MTKLFSLTWRFLLAVALVSNPVAGAAMAPEESAMPPCHGMATHADMAMDADQPAPDAQHGCDCGNAACQFACCAAIRFAIPALRLAPLAHAQALASPQWRGTASPPPARMIRPPIV